MVDQTPKLLLRIKDKGILSAESIVAVRATVTMRFEDKTEPAVFQVNITAPSSDLDLFLIPYSDDDRAELALEILHIYQPYIGNHDKNLEWLDRLKGLENNSQLELCFTCPACKEEYPISQKPDGYIFEEAEDNLCKDCTGVYKECYDCGEFTYIEDPDEDKDPEDPVECIHCGYKEGDAPLWI